MSQTYHVLHFRYKIFSNEEHTSQRDYTGLHVITKDVYFSKFVFEEQTKKQSKHAAYDFNLLINCKKMAKIHMLTIVNTYI